MKYKKHIPFNLVYCIINNNRRKGKSIMSDFEKLAERIYKLRVKKGLCQEELAEVVRLSKSRISAYETKGDIPTLTTVVLLARYFGVSTDYLLGDTEYPYVVHLNPDSNSDYILRMPRGSTEEQYRHAQKLINAEVEHYQTLREDILADIAKNKS